MITDLEGIESKFVSFRWKNSRTIEVFNCSFKGAAYNKRYFYLGVSYVCCAVCKTQAEVSHSMFSNIFRKARYTKNCRSFRKPVKINGRLTKLNFKCSWDYILLYFVCVCVYVYGFVSDVFVCAVCVVGFSITRNVWIVRFLVWERKVAFTATFWHISIHHSLVESWLRFSSGLKLGI